MGEEGSKGGEPHYRKDEGQRPSPATIYKQLGDPAKRRVKKRGGGHFHNGFRVDY